MALPHVPVTPAAPPAPPAPVRMKATCIGPGAEGPGQESVSFSFTPSDAAHFKPGVTYVFDIAPSA